MPCDVQFHPELESLSAVVRVELLAHAGLLAQFGPTLGRPAVDTLKGSAVANLKKLRFNAEGGVWRVAFAFDAKRIAVCLQPATSAVSRRRASTKPCSPWPSGDGRHGRDGG